MYLLVASVARQGKIFESRKKHITGWNVYPQCFAAPLSKMIWNQFGRKFRSKYG